MQSLPSQDVLMNHGRSVGFGKHYSIDELPFQEDVIINSGNIDHQFIEKIMSSRIKIPTITKTVAKATTRKRNNVHFDLLYLETGSVKEASIQPRKTFIS